MDDNKSRIEAELRGYFTELSAELERAELQRLKLIRLRTMVERLLQDVGDRPKLLEVD